MSKEISAEFSLIDRLHNICQTKTPEKFNLETSAGVVVITVQPFMASLVCNYYSLLSKEVRNDFNKLNLEKMIDLAVEKFQSKKSVR